MTEGPIVDESYIDLVQALDLHSIALTECSATRLTADPAANVQLDIQSAIRLGEGDLDYRFEVKCEPTSVEGKTVASLRTVHILNFSADASHKATKAQAQRFAQDVAFMTAYPYIRECLQDLASRIEIPGFTVGLIKRGEFQLDLDEEDEVDAAAGT